MKKPQKSKEPLGRREEEVYDGWSTASCFAYSKYSKAAFWGKTQLTSKTDQWAGPNTFHRPSVRKKETAWGPQTYARASSSYRISIHRIMRSWTSAEMVYKLTNAKHGICLQRAQKADLSYQTETFFTKHWVIEMSNHHPVARPNYWLTSIPRDIVHAFVVLT